MKLFNLEPSSRLSFRNQIVIAFCIGISLLTIISTFIISSISAQTVYKQLVTQGENITSSLAEQSILALLYQSPENAKKIADSTLTFPDVTHVAIYDANKELLYRQGENQLSTEKMPWPSEHLTTISEDQLWYFVAPVFSQSSSVGNDSPFGTNVSERELVGYVQVSISKNTLNSMNQEILGSNLLVTGAIACFLLLLLLGIVNRLTRPLHKLASAMRKAELGETGVRAQLNGSSDIAVMEGAFNKMMGELESREIELVKARDVALDAAKAKGIFAATVSHELRTPMNGVLGMLQLMESTNLAPRVKEYVDVAKSSAKALLLLIDDILDFSKIESGKMKFHMEDFGIRELTLDIIELLALQAKQKGLMLHTIVDSSVPIGVSADAGRIRQVLINLIGNAIKFTEQGQVTVYTSLIDVGDRKMLKFEVNDTGIGISEDAQKRIFDSFVQADGSTTRRYGGTGLGLTICQQLVNLMGGKLHLSSVLDEGSTFSFTLPMKAANAEFIASRKQPFKLQDMRTLVIGDSLDRLETLNLLLLSWKCDSERISDPNKALQRISKAISDSLPYNLVILDLPLPGIDDEEVFTTLSSKTDTHFFVLSDSAKRINLENESIIYLPKAIDSVALYKETNRIIEQPEDASDIDSPEFNGINILVVEDNRTNQLVAMGMLEKLGYHVDIANDGREAIEKINFNRYEIVLMDCHMPGMDGYAATQGIRELESEGQHLPILAMTAHTSSNDRKKCIDAGMDDYLSKPIEHDQLQSKIALWLKVEDRKDESGDSDKVPQSPAITTDESIDTEEEPSIDEDKIKSMQKRLGSTFVKVITSFLEDSPIYINRIEQALDSNNLSIAREITHTLLGSSANVGAKNLYQLCKKLEIAFQEGNTLQARDLLEKIFLENMKVDSTLQCNVLHTKKPEPKARSIYQSSRVLIVDDDRSARFAIRGILETEGYEIIEAENGLRAFEICKAQMPDLILMDAMMPEMDGFQASQEILKIGSNIQPMILVITALHDEESIEKAFNSGATDFIPKPVNLLLLRKRISRLLQSSQSERQVHKLTFYDSLTSLANLELFMDRSRELIKKAYQQRHILGLLSIDLDRFSSINEMYGYETGDQFLKNVAQRLQACFRSSDLIARIRGDEFAVMLEAIQSQDAIVSIARKVHHSLSQPYMLNGQRVHASFSMGIACYPHNSNTIDNLLHSAETARSIAKSKGGASMEVFELEMESEFILQVELEKELQRAIRENELVMLYQPRADIDTGTPCSLETVIRWQHPQRGLMPSSEFLPFAKNSGVLEEICIWMIETVCEQQWKWQQQALNVLPITLTFSQFHLTESLVTMLANAISGNGINSRLINIGITERCLGEESNDITEHLIQLSQLGVSIEVSEFGNSSTSLNYLRNLPIDSVIIDSVLVEDIVDDMSSVTIVEGIISIAHSLDKSVGAHGVNSLEQKQILQGLGCDIAQGNTISKALTPEDCENWIQALPKSVHK